MQTVLIAESSGIFADALAQALAGQFQIFTCADGRTALEMLSRHRPDVLVLNLSLPYLDGLTVLQKTDYRPPMILAIAMNTGPYVQLAITTMDISYTLVSPSVESVVLRLQDLTRVQSEEALLREKAICHLRLLNIPTHLDGYHELCLALPLYYKNPLQFLTKELYPAVAKRFDRRDGRAVEHSIRKAIKAGWLRRDEEIWSKYFIRCKQGFIPCPTNKEFLCRMVEILK